MISLGLFVHKLDLSQHGMQIINNLNKLVDDYNVAVTVFYEEYSSLYTHTNFGMTQSREAWLYPHILMATTLDSAQKILSCIRASHRLFYIWNLDWIYQNKPLTYYMNIYNNEKLDLIARSSFHAKSIENCWKRPIDIVEDFNYHDIAKTIIKLSKPG